MIDYAFILAGGSGTRLWPASTRMHPKQFMKIGGKKSMLQTTIERAHHLSPEATIAVITLEEQLEGVARDCSGADVPPERIVLVPEPFARNTAPAISIAAAWAASGGDRSKTVLSLPADHTITPQNVFAANVSQAVQLAEKGYIVTLGIPPTRPDTGYGYIEAGEPVGPGYIASSFKEKPDEATAVVFLEAGNFYWNSGMFAFTIERFFAELGEHAPEVADAFKPLAIGGGRTSGSRRLHGFRVVMDADRVKEVYKSVPKVSIDYAVAEKSDRVAMVRADFSWSDVGSWDELADQYPSDTGQEPGFRDADVVCTDSSDCVSTGSKGSFVMSDIPVALCGVEDLIVVIQDGKALVCRRGTSQDVKRLVGLMQDEGREDLL